MSSHRSSRGTHGEPHTPRRAVVGCLVLLAGVLLGALTAGPALALPEGRVYEMVSPPYKGGYGVRQIEGVAANGETVAFYSSGVFAGAPSGGTLLDYVAHRTPSGWRTTAVMVPAGLMPNIDGTPDISSTLGTVLVVGAPGPNANNAFSISTQEDVQLHDTSTPDTIGNWEVAGAPFEALSKESFPHAEYLGASGDFCHIFLTNSGAPLLTAAKEAGLPNDVLYEVDRGCGSEPPAERVVELNNNGTELDPSCSTVLTSKGLGSGFGGRLSNFNAIAAGGREVFFTSCAGSGWYPWQLFVRLDGVKTLEVSKPLGEACHAGEAPGQVPEVPCEGGGGRAPADFAGASEDGSKVFFTTTASLVPGAGGGTEELYMAGIGCPLSEGEGCPVAKREVTSLVQVSHDMHPGEDAEVQGVVRVAPDGARIYYVARGVLVEGANADGQAPVAGADNLYVYNSVTGNTSFVAELCSGAEASGPGGSLQDGAVSDRNCPLEGEFDAGLWENKESLAEAQTAGQSGEFLVFSSYGRLVRNDTDNATDVYRYDAETDVLERVSIGEAGYDANGNRDDVSAVGGAPSVDANARIAPTDSGMARVQEQDELGSRAVSEDGSRIVFTSAEPLSPAATNGLANVYEWHKEPGWSEGRVSLISMGSSEEAVEHVVISGTGNDIFFLTSQGLVPQDTDGAPDLYDARLGGGFPVVAAQPQACSGDACQGPLTNPAPLLVPGSVSQAPGENLPAFAPAPVAGAKAKRKAKPRVKKRARKRKVRRALHARRARVASRGRTGQ
jgi:hypothetical protein